MSMIKDAEPHWARRGDVAHLELATKLDSLQPLKADPCDLIAEALQEGDLCLYLADKSKVPFGDIARCWDYHRSICSGVLWTFGQIHHGRTFFFDRLTWDRWASEGIKAASAEGPRKWFVRQVDMSPAGKPQEKTKDYFITEMVNRGQSKRGAEKIWREICPQGHPWARQGRPRKTPA